MTELEYYATSVTDADLDAIADAGDYLNQEQGAAVDERDEDEYDEDVPTLRQVLDEQRRAAGKPPFRASM